MLVSFLKLVIHCGCSSLACGDHTSARMSSVKACKSRLGPVSVTVSARQSHLGTPSVRRFAFMYERTDDQLRQSDERCMDLQCSHPVTLATLEMHFSKSLVLQPSTRRSSCSAHSFASLAKIVEYWKYEEVKGGQVSHGPWRTNSDSLSSTLSFIDAIVQLLSTLAARRKLDDPTSCSISLHQGMMSDIAQVEEIPRPMVKYVDDGVNTTVG
jgi:hypothetical protein